MDRKEKVPILFASFAMYFMTKTKSDESFRDSQNGQSEMMESDLD